MRSSTRNEGDEVIHRVRRRANPKGAWGLVTVGTLIVFGLAMVTVWNITYPNGPLFIEWAVMSAFAAVLIAVGIPYGIYHMRPMTVEVGIDRISSIDTIGNLTQIAWGPDVHVDVKRDDQFSNREFGPLAGITVYCDGGGSVTVNAEEGWTIEDVRGLWAPIIGLVREKGLQIDEELSWYLEYRKDTGKDR
jgi:hypothetical protein